MAGEDETQVEVPSVLPTSVIEEKKDLVDVDLKKDDEEKKDEEKETDKKGEIKKKKPVVTVSPPLSVHKKDFAQDVVYLYQFNRCPNLPSFCSYCMKTETWMKMNSIPYENIDHKSKLRSKKGSLPFIELNGEEISDADIIIKTLAAKFDKNVDEGLSREELNVQYAMLSMVDNHLHWMNTQWNCRNADNILKGYNLNLQKMTNSKFPNSLLAFTFKYTHLRKLGRQLKALGYSGYTDEEINKMGSNDLRVLSDLLGEKQFFFGDEPRSLDISAFVQLAIMLNVDKSVSCAFRDYLESDCTNLIGLYNRIKNKVWGEHWDEAIGDKLEMNPHIPKPEPPIPKEPEDNKGKETEEEKESADEKQDKKEKKEDVSENNKSSENKNAEEKKN